MRILEFVLMLSIGLSSGAFVGGCGDDDDPEAGVPSGCGEFDDGDSRCSADNREVELCSDGQWTTAATCTPEEECVVAGETPQCIAAVDLCTAGDEYAQRCNPDDDLWIQECQNVGTEETPRYEWRDIVDCSLGSAGEVCVFNPDVGSLPICGLPPT